MRLTPSLSLSLSLALALAATASSTTIPVPRDIHNDFSCKSTYNPVVLLHGLGATFYEDLNVLEVWLKTKGYCTFSLTYGSYPNFPLVGGLKPIAQSSLEIASFIQKVHQTTSSPKIDLVGHSEGAFQALYTTKFGGISSLIDTIVAIAPPTHGTSFGGLYKLAQLLGIDNGVDGVLKTFGCDACADLVTGGPAITKLNDATPIVQPGTAVTVIASKYDELVTPTKTSFIDESGVHNIYVQDYCPFDPVGHIGEAYDLNVWNLVLNSLQKKVGRKFFCLAGSPGK